MQLINVFVAVCINTAIVLFVVGLILGDRGKHLRRSAFALFACAFAPTVIVGLLHAAGLSVANAFADSPLTVIADILILSLGAYGAIQLRSRPTTPGGKPHRVQMKKPYTHRRDTDLISMLREEIDRDA